MNREMTYFFLLKYLFNCYFTDTYIRKELLNNAFFRKPET
jgi:hypothetical protein